VSGLLKLYLRELPTNILTSERREGFVKVTEIEDKEKKIRALNELVHSLPTENFALLRALSGHLLRIVDNCAVNKMTIRNVGIVFSPTLNIPALVFSMFLHEYKSIFFRNGEAPAPTSPLTPAPPMTALNSPLLPPTRPSMPSTPTMMPAHPAANRGGQPHAQVVAYEPTYEFEPPSSGGVGQISAPRFNEPFSKTKGAGGDNSLGSDGALVVPGSDSRNTKSRRRESSMMIMMGGMKKSSGMFSPSKSTGMFSAPANRSLFHPFPLAGS
jgi:RalA-binding protein 1